MSPDNHKQGRKSARQRKTTRGGKEKVPWLGYVRNTLTEGDKKKMVQWVSTNPDYDQLIEDVTEKGYDLKIRYDSYNQCFSAQLFCTDLKDSNAGFCLALRASGWYKALQRLLFVHYICFEGEWATEPEVGWDDDNW